MKNHAVFVPEKRQYLFIVDQIGMEQIKPILDLTIAKNLSFELIFLGKLKEHEGQTTNIEHWLRNQKMGVYLYVALPWSDLSKIKIVTEKFGITEDEMQFIGHGIKQINVFCCRCHGSTHAIDGDALINCQHCQLELAVSDHYSSLRDSYLGYVAKL